MNYSDIYGIYLDKLTTLLEEHMKLFNEEVDTILPDGRMFTEGKEVTHEEVSKILDGRRRKL